ASVFFLVLLMFFQSFEMACVVFFVFPAAIWPIVIFGKKMRKKFKKSREVGEGFFDQITQTFKSIKIVKSYCTEQLEFDGVKKTIEVQNKLQFSMAVINALQHPLMEFVGGVGMAATLGYGGYKITAGTMTAGNFMVFLLAIVAAYKPMKNLATLHMTLQQGVVSMQRLFAMLDIVPSIRDKADAKPLEITTGRIDMNRLSFSYDGERPVLKNATVHCEPNQTVAFVGHSGSGKSTMINFIPRFYDPDAGEVLIDGQNVKDVTLESLRKQTAYVSQDVILFHDTIKNNIRYGTPDATDEQIVAAAKAAAAHDFIMGMEDGYDTVLGEQGSGLSGGQRQMISIARAMLKNAPILLLDEATAALDSKSESVVQNSLEQLMKNRTTVVIAHRLSTIINADRIYVFDEGEIVEQGTHAELVALDGVYAQMYRIQYRKAE
ncbi:MAG TPA: ABC transporter permease, partial [Alphaproteobacteria bacterium]|nr:ABC transporter permease [Alphaproteobacteria bacterium]